MIVIVGPDGSGKSSVADGLTRWVAATRPVRRFHHRFRALPMRAGAREPTNEPHRQRPYPPWLTAAKTLYLFVDHLLGLARQRRFVLAGGWVVLERGWWDLIVDPARYRLDPRVPLATWLGRLMPEPDVTFILDAPATTIEARKAELPREELDRQVDMWRVVARRLQRSVLVDATEPAEMVLERIVGRLAARPGNGREITEETARWTALPPRGRARWIVPVAPRRTSRAALTLYQPMTVTGRISWELLRATVAAGGLTILPRRKLPELRDDILCLIPPGGTVSIRQGTRAGRSIALIVDARGRPIVLAKIAEDQDSKLALAREVHAIDRVASLLEPPLSAPRLLSASDGLVLFEPVPWLPRRRPWDLPLELAVGIATLHRARLTPGATAGPGHGDFAPWNVMRTHDGWVVIDWESATEQAPPFDDLFHYVVQGHALLGRPSAGSILSSLAGHGHLGSALSAYAEVIGSSGPDLPEAFVDYLRRSTDDLHPERPDGARGLAARQRLRALLRVG